MGGRRFGPAGARRGARSPAVVSGGGAPPTPTLYGLKGILVTATGPLTADPGGEQGVDTGFGFAVAIRTTTTSMACRIFAASDEGAAGYYLFRTSTLLGVRFFNGVGTAVAAPFYTVTAGALNKVMGIVCVHDGSAARLYVNRVQVGSGTAITGYTPYNRWTGFGTSSSTLGGNFFNVGDADQVHFGATTFRGAPTLANVEAWHDALKANLVVGPMPGVTTTHSWIPGASSGPSPLADSVGSDDLSWADDLTLVSETSPTWGW